MISYQDHLFDTQHLNIQVNRKLVNFVLTYQRQETLGFCCLSRLVNKDLSKREVGQSRVACTDASATNDISILNTDD